LKRSGANGWAFVPGDVNDRHRNVRFFETVPQFDTRTIAQVDVENDANHPVKIALICEGFRRRKQQADVAGLPQQSRYAPQHHRVVIDDKNKVPLWQAGTSMLKARLGSNAMHHRWRVLRGSIDLGQAECDDPHSATLETPFPQQHQQFTEANYNARRGLCAKTAAFVSAAHGDCSVMLDADHRGDSLQPGHACRFVTLAGNVRLFPLSPVDCHI